MQLPQPHQWHRGQRSRVSLGGAPGGHPPSHQRPGGALLNRLFTSHINELSAAESAVFLEFLYAHSERPEFQIRFSWKKNSVAFWDNRAVQHLAIWDYFPEVRSGSRVTIQGDRLQPA